MVMMRVYDCHYDNSIQTSGNTESCLSLMHDGLFRSLDWQSLILLSQYLTVASFLHE